MRQCLETQKTAREKLGTIPQESQPSQVVSGGQEARQTRGCELSDFGNREEGRGPRDTDERRGSSGRRLPSRLWAWTIRKSEVAASGEGLLGRRKMECLICSVKGSLNIFSLLLLFFYF